MLVIISQYVKHLTSAFSIPPTSLAFLSILCPNCQYHGVFYFSSQSPLYIACLDPSQALFLIINSFWVSFYLYDYSWLTYFIFTDPSLLSFSPAFWVCKMPLSHARYEGYHFVSTPIALANKSLLNEISAKIFSPKLQVYYSQLWTTHPIDYLQERVLTNL